MTDQFEMFSDVVSIDKGEGTRVCKYCEKEKGLTLLMKAIENHEKEQDNVS